MHHPSADIDIKYIGCDDSQDGEKAASEYEGEDSLKEWEGEGKVLIKVLFVDFIILFSHDL